MVVCPIWKKAQRKAIKQIPVYQQVLKSDQQEGIYVDALGHLTVYAKKRIKILCLRLGIWVAKLVEVENGAILMEVENGT